MVHRTTATRPPEDGPEPNHSRLAAGWSRPSPTSGRAGPIHDPTPAAGAHRPPVAPAWRSRLTRAHQAAANWRDQLADGVRYRSQCWCNRMARAWYARAATDRVLGGQRLGREVAYQLQRWLARRLRNYASPSARRPRGSPRPHSTRPRSVSGLVDRRTTAPPTGQVIGVCGWAAALGLLGLPVAGRALAAVLAGSRPDWLQPNMLMGVIGIGLAVVAFLTIHRRQLPWLLLTIATVLLLLNSRLS